MFRVGVPALSYPASSVGCLDTPITRVHVQGQSFSLSSRYKDSAFRVPTLPVDLQPKVSDGNIAGGLSRIGPCYYGSDTHDFHLRDIHARHLAICKSTTVLTRRPQGNRNVPQVVFPNTERDQPRRGQSRSYGPDTSWILASSEYYFLHFEQEVLSDYVRNDTPISLDLLARVTTTHGLAGSFDPDLSPHLGSSPSLIPVNVLNNCSDDGGGDLCRGSFESTIDLSTDPASMGWIDTSQFCFRVNNNDFTQSFDDQWLLESDCLFAVSQNIVESLGGCVLHKPRNSYIRLQWNDEIERQCLDFFSPNNLRRFVDLYWLTWYIHWPVIHKSTFQISEAPFTLVAAMVLIGASYSTDPDDRAHATLFCDVVEEMVFGDDYFGDSAAFSVLNAACLERRLRSLQAAHAMCLYQAWEGHDTGKRRARRHRFSAVVAVGALQVLC